MDAVKVHWASSVKPQLTDSSQEGNYADNMIRQHTTFFFNLKSVEQQRSFNRFTRMPMSISLFFVACLFFTIVSLPFEWHLIGEFTRKSSESISSELSSDSSTLFESSEFASMILYVSHVLSLWVCWLLHCTESITCIQQRYPILKNAMAYSQGCHVFTSLAASLFFCSKVFLQIKVGSCDSFARLVAPHSSVCQSSVHSHSQQLPADDILLLLAYPLLLNFVLHDAHKLSAVFSVMTNLAMIFYSSAAVHSYQGWLIVLTYLTIVILCRIEVRLRQLRSFFIRQKLQGIIDDKERQADEMHANEMRSMIGNVAHDLKTPLASFQSGVDLINYLVHEMQTKFQSKTLSKEESDDFFNTITTCVYSIKNTNAFMLMTINRCIDYTKASKGVKLVPKLDTIDLLDTLQLPVNCMVDVQSRIDIQLLEIPTDICSHIITDKQWLQENVLCLLSNAVKYSAGGDAVISVSLRSNNETYPLEESKSLHERYSPSAKVIPMDSSDDRELFRAEVSATSSPVVNGKGTAASSRKAGDCRHFLRVEVEDHGIGIREEEMSQLFTPFKQAQRFAGGTGLGLFSLAKRVEALHGRCGVSNRRDGQSGSLFWFEIPYRPDLVTAETFKKVSGQRTTKTSVRKSGLLRSLPASVSSDGTPRKSVHGHLYPRTLLSPSMSMTNDFVCTELDDEISPPLADGPATSEGNPKSEMTVVNMDRYSRELSIHSINSCENSRKNSLKNGDAKADIKGNTLLDTCALPQILTQPDKSALRTAIPRQPPQLLHSESMRLTDLNILLVEDSPPILKMTSMMLRRHGHAIQTAENGAECLSKIKENLQQHHHAFDVVVMDLQMPVMDGLEATKRIRAMEVVKNQLMTEIQGNQVNCENAINPLEARSGRERKRASIIRARIFDDISFRLRRGDSSSILSVSSNSSKPSTNGTPPINFLHHIIIGISANSDDITSQDALAAGMDAFIPKPFTVDTFYRTLSQARKSYENRLFS